jgi:hypothetical protein
MKKFKILILVLLCFLSFGNKFIFAQSPSTTGFIPSNIWYSKDPFEEGDKIKIYTLVFNSDKRELSGSVLFFDNNVLLGKKNFVASPSSVAQVSINWNVNAGDHDIFAKIESSKFTISTGKYEDVYLNENESEHSKRTVNKKIVLDSTNKNTVETSNNQNVATTGDQISNIANTIKENTPEIIAKPLMATANVTEGFRNGVENNLSKKETEINKDIKNLSNVSNKKTDTSFFKKPSIQKPFKYVQLFFVKLFGFIFKYKIVFYVVSFFIILFLLRFIWQRFF